MFSTCNPNFNQSPILDNTVLRKASTMQIFSLAKNQNHRHLAQLSHVTGQQISVLLSVVVLGNAINHLPLHAAEINGAVQCTDSISIDNRSDEIVFGDVSCDGAYVHHLQGICTNDKDAIYWSFTTALVKTDQHGCVLKQLDVRDHHGDLCHHEGKIYVAVNFGEFNNPTGKADSWVYVYRAKDLEFVSKHAVQQVVYGAGGIGFRDGHFFIVGGLPEDVEQNYVYEYDADFNFLSKHILNSGQTHQGIQTAAFADDKWLFGCYGEPRILLIADADFKRVERFEFDCSLGIVPVLNSQLLAAEGNCTGGNGCTGRARVVVRSKQTGLVRSKK